MRLSEELEAADAGSRELEWFPIEAYSKRIGPVFLCIGETIPDLADVRVGSFCTADEVEEIGCGRDYPFGAWMIWNDCSDWYFLEPSEPRGWCPMPNNFPRQQKVIEGRAKPTIAAICRAKGI